MVNVESSDERRPWDRLPNETPRAYAAFREYRDAGSKRQASGINEKRRPGHERWAREHNWRARAIAWDDELSMIEDAERIEAIREMHRTHRAAGRAAQRLAIEALRLLEPESMTAQDVARLLDLGSRLERDTLEAQSDRAERTTHVDDPWDRIAQELMGQTDAER